MASLCSLQWLINEIFECESTSFCHEIEHSTPAGQDNLAGDQNDHLRHRSFRQLVGLEVKSFACCAGGPGFNPRAGNQNFQMAFISTISASLSIACDIKSEGTLYSVFYAEVSKRPHTWELRVPCVDSQPYLIIMSASGSCSHELIKLQSQ